MKKNVYWVMMLASFLFAASVQAETIIDRLANRDLWYAYASATPSSGDYITGDPLDTLAPSDAWVVQDGDGSGKDTRWTYRTHGWNKIISVKVSTANYTPGGTYTSYYFGAYNYATGAELDNKVITPGPVSPGNSAYTWKTVSYRPTGDVIAIQINGQLNNWPINAGTVIYEIAPMLGNLIDADTVDPMTDYSKWYDADTLRDGTQWYLNPGNIITSNMDNLKGDPLGPDDGYCSHGKWNNYRWATYKTASGKYFGQVSISFVQYTGAPAGVAYVQYWDGSDWVNATQTASTGPTDSSHPSYKWYTRSYDLTGMEINMIRVFSDAYPWSFTPRVGTVDIKVVPQYLTGDLNKNGVVDLADFALFAADWLKVY